jgi:hypothetical protein
MITLEVLELPLGTDLFLASRRETPESANGTVKELYPIILAVE